MELEVQTTSIARMMRVKCLVVQQGELAPRTQEHPSQERVGTSMLTQCTLGFDVAHWWSNLHIPAWMRPKAIMPPP